MTAERLTWKEANWSPVAKFLLIVTTGMLIMFVAASFKGCDFGPPILSVSDHVKYGETGKPTTEEYQEKVRFGTKHFKGAEYIVDKIDEVEIDDDHVMDIDDLWDYYLDKLDEYTEKGEKKKRKWREKDMLEWARREADRDTREWLKESKMAYVIHPKWWDIKFTIINPKGGYRWNVMGLLYQYGKDGVDLTSDPLVYTGLTDLGGNDLYLPEHLWNAIRDSIDEAGLTLLDECPRGETKDDKLHNGEVCIRWGIRDYKLQAVMYVRTVLRVCGNNPFDWCEKKVRTKQAGKPSKPGFTHTSADMSGWKHMVDPLGKRGIRIGCKGVGFDDKGHGSFALDPFPSKKYSCEALSILTRTQI